MVRGLYESNSRAVCQWKSSRSRPVQAGFHTCLWKYDDLIAAGRYLHLRSRPYCWRRGYLSVGGGARRCLACLRGREWAASLLVCALRVQGLDCCRFSLQSTQYLSIRPRCSITQRILTFLKGAILSTAIQQVQLQRVPAWIGAPRCTLEPGPLTISPRRTRLPTLRLLQTHSEVLHTTWPPRATTPEPRTTYETYWEANRVARSSAR